MIKYFLMIENVGWSINSYFFREESVRIYMNNNLSVVSSDCINLKTDGAWWIKAHKYECDEWFFILIFLWTILNNDL